MAIRWDHKPLFPHANPDGELILLTRRTAISGSLAFVGFVIATWNVSIWQFLIIAAAIVLAFDAGDMRFLFSDDEPEKLEDGTFATPHDRFYYAGQERQNPER